MTVPRRRTVALASPGQDADVSRILQATRSATPATSAGVPALVLTIGLPGSGKSTFARRLAPQIDAVILESDALRRLLFGEPSYSARESKRLFAAIHAAARELLNAGRNVIIDATSITESDRRAAYEVAERTSAGLMQLRFSAHEDVIEQRLARRAAAPDPADSSSAGIGVYRRMAEREEVPVREYWDIDTSDAAETEAALSRVVEACRQGAGRAMGGIR